MEGGREGKGRGEEGRATNPQMPLRASMDRLSMFEVCLYSEAMVEVQVTK